MRLIADMIAYTVEHVPKWNPINICSYHLQEAGATPVQEIAYAMSNAIAVLDAARERVASVHAGDETAARELMGQVFGRISFFVNAGVRFVEEHAKLRAMGILWEELGRERYGVTDPKHLRFRYGVQVNSLGLTEAQPENNVQRIVLETLAVTLGRDARARAVQLPAWNEALGLPRPWDQQWSLRIQQVMAYETDLLEYPDIFEGSHVMDGLVAELLDGARAEIAVVAEHGGAVEAVPVHEGRARGLPPPSASTGSSPASRSSSGRTASPRPSRLAADRRRRGRHPRRRPRRRGRADRGRATLALRARPGRRRRGPGRSGAGRRGGELAREPDDPDDRRRARRRDDRRVGTNIARGVRHLPRPHRRGRGQRTGTADADLTELREEVARLQEQLGRRPKILVGKPGLDGHSNGAEQIAVRARDSGMDVVYEGIRLTPAQIAASALQEGVHVIGLSILSGSHRELIPAVIDALREAGVTAPVVVGGIIPDQDVEPLKQRRGRACLHAEGLRPHADHARHRGVGGQRRRIWHRRRDAQRQRLHR